MLLKFLTLTLAAALTLIPAAVVRAQSSLSADDYAEIHNLYAHYNLVLDAGDSEAWADTFTADGRFKSYEGRSALIEFAYEVHAAYLNTRHWNSNIHLAPTADGAAGAAYLILWDVGARPQSISLTGTYQDTLVRTPNGWRFRSRRVQIDPPASP
jgi:3-phenylpropionate/cinnamic acid dioxygenase small subunit